MRRGNILLLVAGAAVALLLMQGVAWAPSAGPLDGSARVREQNLDADGNIKVREQGTTEVHESGTPFLTTLHDFCSEDSDPYAVPFGQQLVVESFAGRLTVPADERRGLQLLVRPPDHPPAQSALAVPIPTTFELNQGSVDLWVTHEATSLRLAPGATVELRLICPTEPSAGGVLLTLSGRLVPVR